MQELGKSDFETNIMLNVLEKYTSFTINTKLSFSDSFQLLSSSLDSLFKNLGKEFFKYLSQELDNNKLDLVKQKECFIMSIWAILKSLKKNCLAKGGFIVSWSADELVTKNMTILLMFGINLKWKLGKIITTCT